MKKISILFNPDTNPVVKNSSKSYGIRLDEAPSSDVTVSFSAQYGYVTFSSSLIFTPINYNIPQAFTITGVNDGLIEGKKIEKIILTPSGGGYISVKSFNINVCDAGLDSQFVSGYNWKKYITITQSSQIATKRTTAINYLFNGNGIPTRAVPDSETLGYTGLIFGGAYANLNQHDGIDAQVWVTQDVDGYNWVQNTYHIKKTGATKCVHVLRGHGSELYHEELINQLNADGFSVFYSGMPISLTNTTNNPTITGIGVSAHNALKTGGLDRVGYAPMNLYLNDKFYGLNYLDANYTYTSHYITGCSGGGFTSALIMAISERFTKGVSVRGFKPPYFCSGFITSVLLGTLTVTDELVSNRDYEQYGGNTISGNRLESFYFNDVTFFDIYLLAGSNNRLNQYNQHAADACCHNKFTFNLFTDYLSTVASSLGSHFSLTLETNPAYTTHGWNVNDRLIISNLF